MGRDNSAQYFGVHHDWNEEKGKHGLVEKGSENDDEHADIAVELEIGSAVTDLIRCDSEIYRDLRNSRYAWIPASRFSIAPSLSDERKRLWSEWDHLRPDRYLQNGASFRMRRLGYFELMPATGGLRPLSHAPYHQSRDINRYASGVHRQFAPLRDSTVTNRFLRELIRFNFSQLPVEGWKAVRTWTVDVHLFRIIGRPDEAGEPTPEGVHHDGDEFNAIHLVRRQNAVGGVSGVYDNHLCPLKSLTLREPMDSLILWDPHVMHGVSPIRPEGLGQPAIRDVLIIGYNPAEAYSNPGSS